MRKGEECLGNKLSEGVVGLRIADDGTRSLHELDVLVHIGLLGWRRGFVQAVVMMRMRIVVLELRIGAGILREISWVRCWILWLVLMVLVEVLMDVAAEPRRMAADTAQTAQIAAES